MGFLTACTGQFRLLLIWIRSISFLQSPAPHTAQPAASHRAGRSLQVPETVPALLRWQSIGEVGWGCQRAPHLVLVHLVIAGTA